MDKHALTVTNVQEEVAINAKTGSVLTIIMGAVVQATMNVQATTATRALANRSISVTTPLHLVVLSLVVLFLSALSSVSLSTCVKDDREVK